MERAQPFALPPPSCFLPTRASTPHPSLSFLLLPQCILLFLIAERSRLYNRLVYVGPQHSLKGFFSFQPLPELADCSDAFFVQKAHDSVHFPPGRVGWFLSPSRHDIGDVQTCVLQQLADLWSRGIDSGDVHVYILDGPSDRVRQSLHRSVLSLDLLPQPPAYVFLLAHYNPLLIVLTTL